MICAGPPRRRAKAPGLGWSDDSGGEESSDLHGQLSESSTSADLSDPLRSGDSRDGDVRSDDYDSREGDAAIDIVAAFMNAEDVPEAMEGAPEALEGRILGGDAAIGMVAAFMNAEDMSLPWPGEHLVARDATCCSVYGRDASGADLFNPLCSGDSRRDGDTHGDDCIRREGDAAIDMLAAFMGAEDMPGAPGDKILGGDALIGMVARDGCCFISNQELHTFKGVSPNCKFHEETSDSCSSHEELGSERVQNHAYGGLPFDDDLLSGAGCAGSYVAGLFPKQRRRAHRRRRATGYGRNDFQGVEHLLEPPFEAPFAVHDDFALAVASRRDPSPRKQATAPPPQASLGARLSAGLAAALAGSCAGPRRAGAAQR